MNDRDDLLATALEEVNGPVEAIEALRRSVSELEHRRRQDEAAQRIAHFGYWERTLCTDQLRWTDEVFRIFGLAPHEFEPTSAAFFSFVHPEDREAVSQAVARSIAQRRPYSIRHRIVRRDGTIRVVDEVGEVIEEDGTPSHMIGTVHDVTGLIEAETALAESEARLRRAQSFARVGSWGQDIASGEEYWSDELYGLFGLEPGAVEGSFDAIDPLIHPDDRKRMSDAASATLAAGSTFDVQIRVATEEGERIFWVRAELTRDDDGTPVRWDGTTQDVTELVRAQSALAEREEFLRATLEAVRSGVVVVDLEGSILTANEQASSILGYSTAELADMPTTEIISAEDQALGRERHVAHLAGETGPPHTLARARRKDGSWFDMDIRGAPLTIDGNVTGVVVDFRDASEELQAQRRLEDAVERLDTVFETVSTGLAIIGPDGRPLTVNQALCDITGYSRETLLSSPFEQSFHADEVESLLLRFTRRLTGALDERAEYRTRMIRQGGSTADVNVSTESFRIDDQFIGVLVEIRDVTEEMLLQRQVQETASRLNDLFESVSTGLVVIGPDRRPLTVNRALCDITGYSREMLLGSPFDELFHRDDLRAVLERFATGFAGDNEPNHLQARVFRLDGSVITIDLSAEPFRDGGEIVGVLAEIRDITDDLKLQQQVQEAADKLNTVFESVSTGLAVIGPDRRPQTMNQAFCDIVGRSQEELSAEPFDRFIHPDDLELILGRFARRLAGEEIAPHHIDVRVIRGDGELIDIDLSAEPFVVEGEVTGVLAELRDITERKRAEQQLQRLNSELGAKSRERQALVQQLLTAQEEERRTVAYEIHDGPAQQLAAAQMFLETYTFEQGIDFEDGGADHLQRASSLLTSGLADTRRIMSGLRPALLDDVGLVDALHELLRKQVERSEIQLEFDATELVDELSPALEITLYRVAQEATSNAVKYSGSDCLCVHLRSDGRVVHLQVEDRGHGFDSEAIEGPRDGHRFGLVGMRERVELLEGQFEIDSARGRGTTITASIPLSEERG